VSNRHDLLPDVHEFAVPSHADALAALFCEYRVLGGRCEVRTVWGEVHARFLPFSKTVEPVEKVAAGPIHSHRVHSAQKWILGTQSGRLLTARPEPVAHERRRGGTVPAVVGLCGESRDPAPRDVTKVLSEGAVSPLRQNLVGYSNSRSLATTSAC
jgi:hypothetical protein